MDLFTVFMTSLITENVVLTKFLGICSFLGSSNKEKNAIIACFAFHFCRSEYADW